MQWWRPWECGGRRRTTSGGRSSARKGVEEVEEEEENEDEEINIGDRGKKVGEGIEGVGGGHRKGCGGM